MKLPEGHPLQLLELINPGSKYVQAQMITDRLNKRIYRANGRLRWKFGRLRRIRFISAAITEAWDALMDLYTDERVNLDRDSLASLNALDDLLDRAHQRLATAALGLEPDSLAKSPSEEM